MKPKTPQYTPVDLGPLLPGEATVRKLNERGTVLVAYQKRPDASFLWENGRRSALPKGFTALDLNNRGEVAGFVGEGEKTRAALLRGGAVVYPLPEPEPEGTRALSVNDAGAALVSLAGVTYALLKDGVRTPLPNLGAPVAMNNGGAVLWREESGSAGSLWRPNATVKIDGLPGQDWTYVTGVNNTDVVSGYTSSSGPGWLNAFRVARGKLEKLAKIPYSGPVIGKDTWYGGAALAVADSGDIVGYGVREVWSFAVSPDAARYCGARRDAPDTGTVAALWRDGTPFVLNRCLSRRGAWHLQEAVSVNSRGQILVAGWSGKSPRLVLLNPAGKAR